MELTRLEKAEPDAKGAVAVEATASAEAVHGLLAEFYETVAAAKGLAPDQPWDDVEAAAQAGMGAEAFRELRRDFVVNRMASEALGALGLTPALTPKIHVLAYPVDGEEFSVELSVVEQPRLALTSYEPVEVTMDEVTVTDRMVAARVAEVLDRYATYEDAEPRPVAAGDLVAIDVDTQQGDTMVPHLSGKQKVLAMDGEAMPAPFLAAVLGMEVGETKVVEYAVERPRAISPDDVDRYISTVTVVGQLRKVEVELTDAWVRAHYPTLSSVEEFFAETRKDVAYDAKLFNRDTVAHLANLELEKRLVGDIPDEFYQASYKSLFGKFERDLAQQGKTLDDYYEEEQTNEQELSVKMLIQSGENLRQGFALEALFDGRGMTLSDEDVEAAAARFFGGSPTADELRRTGRARLAESMAKRAAALSWLVETAVVKGA